MTSVAAPMRKAISHSSRRSRIFTRSPPGHAARADASSARVPPSLRLEPRGAVHLLDDVLADARLVFLVHGQERLLHVRLFGGAQRDDLRLAALLHRFQRIVVLLLGDVVG